MGLTYEARTVIGLKIPKEYLFREEPYNMSHCRCTPKKEGGSTKYCADCGQILNHELIRSVPIHEGFEGDISIGTIRGWEYIGDAFEPKDYFVCIARSETGCHYEDDRVKFLRPDWLDSDGIREQFEEEMKELGWWDESNFGIWTILYIG